MEQEEHEVYGADIPDEAEMDADVDLQEHDDEQDHHQHPSNDPNKVRFVTAEVSLSLSLSLSLLGFRDCICVCVCLFVFLNLVLEFFLCVTGLGGHEEEAEGDRGRSQRPPRNAGQGRERDGRCSRFLFPNHTNRYYLC